MLDWKAFCPKGYDKVTVVLAIKHLAKLFADPSGVLELPEGVQIGEKAFLHCTGLTAVRVPDTATIGCHAFEGCSGLPASRLTELEARYED